MANLSYQPPQPQDSDSELTIDHKTAVSIAGGFSANHISTNTTTLVKTGAGILHSITVNTKGAAANVATIYDSLTATGTVIAVLDTTAGPSNFMFDVNFALGLTILTATGTAADITVAYR